MRNTNIRILQETEHQNNLYLGFTPGDSDDLIQRVFQAHYKYDPQEIIRLPAIVLAGPVIGEVEYT